MFTTAEAFEIANGYYRTGQLAAARQMYLDLLNLEPHHAGAWYFLGGIALQGGDLEQTIACLERAVQYDADNAVFWYDLGFVCLQSGKFQEAAAACAQALRIKPVYAEAYHTLGIVCQKLQEIDQARECYEEAIRLNPLFAEAYSNLGMVLHEAGKPQEAADCYRKALNLRPNFPDALHNLATILKEEGYHDDALAHYRETLRLQPSHAWTYYNLSQFVAEGRFAFSADERQRLEALVAEGHGSLAELSTHCFALATVLDAEGTYEEAFPILERANQMRHKELRDLNSAFDVGKHHAGVERVMATFDTAYFRKVQGWGRDTELPVFVLGVPRSGTTLVEQIVSSHPEVYGAGELSEMPRLMVGLTPQTANGDRYAPMPFPSRAVCGDLAAGYLRRIERLGDGARRVIIKSLENYLYLGMLATLFPHARVIYCRRDPLDVCVSCYFQNFQGSDFSWSLENIGAYYRHYERLMAHWRRVLPMPILEVSYEDLIAHPEAVTRQMLDFCDLEWHPRCLSFFQNRRPVRTASMLQVRKPLSAKSIGRWKHYRRFLTPLFEALGLPADVLETVPSLDEQSAKAIRSGRGLSIVTSFASCLVDGSSGEMRVQANPATINMTDL